MLKTEYSRPELSVIRFTLRDVILSSPEGLTEYGNGSELPDPILDPDEPINWG